MPHPEFLAGQRGYAEDLEALSTFGTYEPELLASNTNPSLGVFGSTAGEFYVSGKLVTVYFEIIFGTSGSSPGDGSYHITLPPDLPVSSAWGPRTPFGQLICAGSSIHLAMPVKATTEFDVFFMRLTSTSGLINHSNPFAWGNEDTIHGSVRYLTD